MSNGNVSEKHEVTNADIIAGRKRFENVSPTVNEVLVVANIPSAEDITALKLLTTSTAVQNYGFTIASQSTPGITRKTLMGNKSVTTGQGTYYEVNVVLSALTARFEIGNVVPGTGVSSVKLEGVWINNYRNGNNTTTLTKNDQNSNFWGTSPAANNMGSEEALTPVTLTHPYTPGQYYNAHDGRVDGTAFVYAYQLFAGNYIPHIIMLVSGQYDNDDYFLAWLTFNKILDGSTPITKVEKNVIYKVGLSGIPVNATNLTPTPEMASIDLGIQCTITPWTVKNVTPGIE